MTEPLHPDLELQDLLDNRLGAAEQARVQAHVDACERCRAELDTMRIARVAARQLPRFDAPAGLRRDLINQLGNRARQAQSQWRGLAYGLPAAAALVLIAVYLGSRPDLPAAAVRSAVSANGALEYVTTDHAGLERFFAGRLPFHTRVFDLAMMNYRLVGGRVGQIESHQAAIYTYAGPGDRRLTCEMYTGSLDELPKPDERRSHNDISFLVYKRGATTAVFWVEGDLICVAVSDMPTDEVVALAFAKAIKV